MNAATENRSLRSSQMALSYPDGKSIIPPENARCPNCHKTGGVIVRPGNGTMRTPEGRVRNRICLLCTYEFETNMALPIRCPSCNEFDGGDLYSCKKTKNIRSGIVRTYKCGCCGANVPTFEPFPVPDHLVKKPTAFDLI